MDRNRMTLKMTRRDAIKLGTGAAVSSAAAPLFSLPVGRSVSSAGESSDAPTRDTPPNSPDEICFMRAVDIMAAIRKKKLSSREVMQAHLKQISRVNAE